MERSVVGVANALVASGVFVSLLPLGLVGARLLNGARARDGLALALPLAIAAWSVPMTLSIAFAHFHARWNGALGWLIAIAAAALVGSDRFRAFRRELLAAIAKQWLALVVLASAAVVYSLAVVESPIGSRDEGLYTLAGLALARSGAMEVVSPDALARASGLFEPFVSGIRFWLPGIPDAERLRSQFPPVLPAWIAQLHAIGGDAFLYRINLLFAVAAGAVFHALSRRVLRPALALVALVAFLLNPAQVWAARINLAEPLATLLVIAGLLVAVDYVRNETGKRLALAAALFALAAAVRLDMVGIAPLLTASALVAALALSDRRRAESLFRLGGWVLAAQSLAIALVGAWSPAYVLDHLGILLRAPAASCVVAILYVLVTESRFERPRLVERAALVVCAAVALLFAYAAFVRPFSAPFAVIADRGSALAGMRDYREESLRDLAAYLGWPLLAFALAGALVRIRHASVGRGSAATLPIFVLALGTAIVYLWAPGVSPDHPWAIRRMVTLVIPLSILLAGYGLQAALLMVRGSVSRLVPALAACALVTWMLLVQRDTLAFSENRGLTARLRALDAEVPAGALIVRDLKGLETTFALGFGRTVLPLRDEHVRVDAASRAFWSSCEHRNCTILSRSSEGLDGLAITEPTLLQVSRVHLDPTVHPLAVARRRETLQFLAARVGGVATTPPPRNGGSARDWRLDDAGFHRDELSSGAVARWTDGSAELELPRVEADRLELRLASAMAKPQPLTIAIDGVTRFDGTIAPGESRWTFPLAQSGAPAHRLAISSARFIPAAIGQGADRRALGVSVRAIRMLDDAVGTLSAASPSTDFRSGLTLTRIPQDSPGAGVEAFRVDLQNLGTAIWTAQADARAGVAPVALGSYWTRVGSDERIAEQRVELPYSLHPGERWTTSIVSDRNIGPLRTLPPGHYELHVAVVAEGVAWFPERGDRGVTIGITIPQPRSG